MLVHLEKVSKMSSYLIVYAVSLVNAESGGEGGCLLSRRLNMFGAVCDAEGRGKVEGVSACRE